MTRIEINYDRIFSNATLQELLARAAATLNVLGQLGAAYQSLPGIAMAAYQTEADSLETDLATFGDLIDQLRALLITMDAKAAPLDEKNKRALHTLRGLLEQAADIALLDQITGPSSQPSSPTPPTP